MPAPTDLCSGLTSEDHAGFGSSIAWIELCASEGKTHRSLDCDQTNCVFCCSAPWVGWIICSNKFRALSFIVASLPIFYCQESIYFWKLHTREFTAIFVREVITKICEKCVQLVILSNRLRTKFFDEKQQGWGAEETERAILVTARSESAQLAMRAAHINKWVLLSTATYITVLLHITVSHFETPAFLCRFLDERFLLPLKAENPIRTDALWIIPSYWAQYLQSVYNLLSAFSEGREMPESAPGGLVSKWPPHAIKGIFQYIVYKCAAFGQVWICVLWFRACGLRMTYRLSLDGVKFRVDGH